MSTTIYPRTRDLNEDIRELFEQFLTGQTRPLIEGVSDEEQDAYYPWDLENFMQKKENQFWD